MGFQLKNCMKRVLEDVKKYGYIGVLIMIYYFTMHGIFHAFCPVLLVTGFPCPGCGTNRAILLLLYGQFERALNLNPMAVGWMLLGIWIFIKRYWQGKKITGLKQAGTFLAVSMIIIYCYKMVVLFPGRPPMTFWRDNLLGRVFEHYNEFARGFF